jgi:protein-S-isoprenylcysteine O-methyltransferase Ste14
MPPAEDSAHVRVFPPAIYLVALGAGVLLQWAYPLSLVGGWRPPGRAVGYVLVAGGVLLMASAVALFRGAGTTPNPTRPTTTLVFRGPYRVTRNPMYVGMTAITSGLGLVAGTPWTVATAVVAAWVTHRFVIAREERYLEQKFGAPYVDYTRRVRRWL